MDKMTYLDDRTLLLTPIFRCSFPEVFRPSSLSPDQKPTYKITMLFDKKTADLSALKATINALVKKRWGKTPAAFENPLKDGDNESYDGYAGCWFIRAKTARPVHVVDENNIIMGVAREHELYGGCYGRARLTAAAYDYMNKGGVSFYLTGVQKVRDGDPFTGRVDVETLFEPIDESETGTEPAVDATEVNAVAAPVPVAAQVVQAPAPVAAQVVQAPAPVAAQVVQAPAPVAAQVVQAPSTDAEDINSDLPF